MQKLALAALLSLPILAPGYAHTNADFKSWIRGDQKSLPDWPIDVATSDTGPCSPYFDSWQEGYPGTERC
jgi:hypothetical protein